jgi:hypothetical protein
MSIITPPLQHSNVLVRNASNKILIDIHKRTGQINEEFLKDFPPKIKAALLHKVSDIKVEVQEAKEGSNDDEDDDDN